MVSTPTHSNSALLVAEVIDHGPISAQQLIVVALCLILNMLDGFGAVLGSAMAGVMIASGVSMAGNFFIFAMPMAIGGIVALLVKREIAHHPLQTDLLPEPKLNGRCDFFARLQ